MSEYGMETPNLSCQKDETSTMENVMLALFQYSPGPVLEYYQERGVTINSEHFNEMLCNKLWLRFGVNSEDNCQKVLCCCMTMPIPYCYLQLTYSCTYASELRTSIIQP
jgi:hypothetical protein